ncbi:MAG: hypothetical protein IT290_11275 [Deltaproteobacteria bacterium]|nr:hypothetical protein [Deltaproteobacteria bacterium]
MAKPKTASFSETLLYVVSVVTMLIAVMFHGRSERLALIATASFFMATMLNSLRINGLPRKARVFRRVRSRRSK